MKGKLIFNLVDRLIQRNPQKAMPIAETLAKSRVFGPLFEKQKPETYEKVMNAAFSRVSTSNLKTLEDLKRFNKDMFGIRHFDIENFDLGKYVTDGLAEAYNSTGGRIKFPRRISYKLVSSSAGNIGEMGYCRETDEIIVNSNLYKEVLDIAKKRGISLKAFMEEFAVSKQNLSVFGRFKRSPYHAIFHELGHLNHAKFSSNYRYLSKPEELKARGLSDKTGLVNEFLTNKEEQATARKISEYAQSSPAEFVAETAGILASGQKVPEDVIKLYKKFGGAKCFLPKEESATAETASKALKELAKTSSNSVSLSELNGWRQSVAGLASSLGLGAAKTGIYVAGAYGATCDLLA